tara:strand:- start:2958 stop:3572 length:615 start_codon:yes stop_codon:yes gene_type:complete
MPIKALLSLNPSDRAYQKRVSKRLTRKEELFVKALVSRDGEITNTEAAIEAGYAKGSAHVRASELLNPYKCPHVVRYLQTYRTELDRKYAVTYQRHIKRLDQLSRRAEENGAYSASVMAEYRRGQAQGIYIDRKEILHGSIDQMNKDEVLKRLKEIKNDETRGDTENLIIEHQSQEEVGETLLPEDKKQPEESSENNKQELDVA